MQHMHTQYTTHGPFRYVCMLCAWVFMCHLMQILGKFIPFYTILNWRRNKCHAYTVKLCVSATTFRFSILDLHYLL